MPLRRRCEVGAGALRWAPALRGGGSVVRSRRNPVARVRRTGHDRHVDLVVRPYAAADREAVVALSLRAWAPVFVSIREALRGSGTYELQYPDGWEVAQRAAVGHACDDADVQVLVADVDGAVAGFTAVALHTDDRMGEIHMLAVDPARQRRGVGRALTAAALEQMRGHGMTSAMVETGGDPGHAPARAAYEAAGFSLFPVSRYFRSL